MSHPKVAPPAPPFLLDRLRTAPIPATVPGSLPVLFFGDLFAASIATIGINPSRREYLAPDGTELEGAKRRFESLRSLGVRDRASLTDSHADAAIGRMQAYFDPGRPIYSWFGGIGRVVEGMGFSFERRSAAHLDLVQEATDPVWSRLRRTDRPQADTALHRDLPFLCEQIERFPLRAVVCTSARVMKEIASALGARDVAEGKLARVTWRIALADVQRGVLGIAGWNIPLARPTGLTNDGQHELGTLLRKGLDQAGMRLET
jgi:hypothetical protein